MSLFESASLVITPNGTKASKLYAIKPTSGAGDLSVTRATTATRVNASGLIESVANNVPRLDYTNSTCPSILVEPQRTNLALYSEDFTNATWLLFSNGTGVNPIVTGNTTTSPSGVQNADTIVLNSGAGATPSDQSSIYQPFITTNGNVYTFSFYAKGVIGGEQIMVRQAGAASYTKLTLTNQWQRYEVTETAILTGISFLEIIIRRGLNEPMNASATFAIYGAQLEAGSYATSYIPTTSASVTRNADAISKTGISDLIGQTEGTLYTEFKVNKLIGTASRYIFHVSDGTANNRIYMAFSGSSSNVLRGRIFNGGTLQCTIDTSALTNTGTYKLALAYKNNDIVFYVNGVQIGVDTSATIPTCSRVDLGQNYAGASQLGDGINNANIWKTRLTNTELETLTTI
jgi:hypothetical protein